MKRITRISALLLAGVSANVLAEGTSPWLPIPGQLSVSVGYADQSGDSAYIGTQELDIDQITGGGADEFERETSTIALSYGLSDSLALDAVVSYAEVDSGRADSDRGLGDSLLGLSWRVSDEYVQTQLPTITLRVGAILKGAYNGARLASIGKDANALEFAAIIGKSFTPWLSLSAQAGVQDYDDDVPTYYFYELGAHFTPAPGWSIGLGYAEKEGDTDLDIGEPGFSPARFQEVAEERSMVKASVGYGFGNQGIALLFSQVVDGRNTVEDDSLGFSYTYAF